MDELIAGKTVYLTQFGRIIHELGTDLIFAKTPQAKVRIERLWIDAILCVKHKRKTDNAGTFSFKNRCFQTLNEGFPIINAGRGDYGTPPPAVWNPRRLWRAYI